MKYIIPLLLLLSACSSHRQDAEDFFEAENFEQALFHFEQALKLNPNDWTLTYNLARTYEELNEFDRAIPLYGKCLEKSLNDTRFI